MRPHTCRPRIFAFFAATISFVALATPILLTAQAEQEQPNNQTNYFVKNLDTLEDTWTVARCMSNASLIFADTRPGTPDRGTGFYSGACAVYPNTYKLSGECVSRSFLQGICTLRWEPNLCPPGLFVSIQDRGYETCNHRPAYLVDVRKPCD